MAKVISFLNMKGGVGKTTLCINVAYTLANHFEKKVLIIDMDPQFNATQALMQKFRSDKYYESLRKEQKTISYILGNHYGGVVEKQDKLSSNDIIDTLNNENLHLIPGDLAIIDFESSKRGSERILKDYIDNNGLQDDYEYILIDSPPTYSVFSISSLIASDYFLVPIAPDVFSVLGYELLARIMSNDLALKGSNIKELGIVFTMVKDRPGQISIMEQFDGYYTFDSYVKDFERIRTGKLESFILDMQTSKEDIISITDEIITRCEEVNDE